MTAAMKRRFIVESGKNDGVRFALLLPTYALYLSVKFIGSGVAVLLGTISAFYGAEFEAYLGISEVWLFPLTVCVIAGTIVVMNQIAGSGCAVDGGCRSEEFKRQPLPLLFFCFGGISVFCAGLTLYGIISNGSPRMIFAVLFVASTCGMTLILRRRENVVSKPVNHNREE